MYREDFDTLQELSIRFGNIITAFSVLLGAIADGNANKNDIQSTVCCLVENIESARAELDDAICSIFDSVVFNG